MLRVVATISAILLISVQSEEISNENRTWWDTALSWGESAAGYWNTAAGFAEEFSASSPSCDRTVCTAGHRLVRNVSAPLPAPNGCGSYGFLLPSQILIGFTSCCDMHDLCYAKCGARRRKCDKDMTNCHASVCRTVGEFLGNDSSIIKGCYSMVTTMTQAVRGFGCRAYQYAQHEQCYCRKRSIKNRS